MSQGETRTAIFVIAIIALAGCAATAPDDDTTATGTGAALIGAWPDATIRWGAMYTPSRIIDDLRAGGEPTIVATDEGTLIVAAHPGSTHLHPTKVPDEAILPTQGQSYVWRSADGGETWSHVSMLDLHPMNSGPRGGGFGMSDPDLAIDGNGRIYLTDLEALVDASVSWSDDDGLTWDGVVSTGWAYADRQWLAASHRTVYLTSGGFTAAGGPLNPGGGTVAVGGANVVASVDGTIWESRGRTVCSYNDIVAAPDNDTLYQACTATEAPGPGIGVSHDGGWTWHHAPGPIGCGHCSPGLDAGGNIWLAGLLNGTVHVAWSPDEGATWNKPVDVQASLPELEGSAAMWPTLWAGSGGRAAVTWLGAPSAQAVDGVPAWHAYSVLIVNATSKPELWPARLTDVPLHRGNTCIGVTCQYTGLPNGDDRRMGDLFETTISPDGRLHVVYTNTEAYPDHAVGHVAFHKQIAGPSLVVGDVPQGFPRQG